MEPATIPDIPRMKFGLWMGLATALALVLCWVVAVALGGSSESAIIACRFVAIGSIATLAPILLQAGASHWGVLVMVSGMLRSLTAVGLAYSAASEHASRPIMLAAVSATGLLLVVESALAIRMLSKLDRERAGAGPLSAAQRN